MQQRLFEDLIESDVVAHKTKQGYTLPVSIAIHVIVLLAVVVVPLLTSEELPEPTSVVKAFFVEPAAPPPPPPPPPPPAPRQQNQPKPMSTPVPTENKFQAPVETPEQVKPEEGHRPRGRGRRARRCRGWRARRRGRRSRGRIAGRASASAGRARRRADQGTEEAQERHPAYPDIAKQARVQGVVILECTISPQGKVTDVKVLRGIPLLDSAAIEAVKQWVYSPTLLNGVPVPVIMTVTVNFRLS